MAARDYILHNFWWKLLSLLLAALTWLTIQTEFQKDQNLQETPVVTSSSRNFMSIPVTVLSTATNLYRFRLDPPNVAVEISGTADVLSKLQERDIHVYIDVSNAGDERQFRRNVQAQVPGNLRIEHIGPSSIHVERLRAGAPSETNDSTP